MRCSQRSINSFFSDGHCPESDSWEIPWPERHPKVLNLCKAIWPAANHDLTDVRPLGQGSYNITIAISIFISGDKKEYVLRLPSWGNGMMRSVGILQYLNKTTDLEIPNIVAFDKTFENELEYPYMVVTRISGVPLDSVLGSLTHEQKLLLAEDLGKSIMKIQSIKSPVAGEIMVHAKNFGLESDIDDHVYVQAFGSEMRKWRRQHTDWTNEELDHEIPLERLFKDPENLPMNDIVLGIFRRRIYRAYNPGKEHQIVFTEVCHNVIEEMANTCLFNDDTISLFHTDLYPRNIMVDFSQRPVITGIIDWDDTMFVPTFITAVYPRWLWRNDYPDSDDSEPEPEPESLDMDALGADTPENKIIQDTFNHHVTPQWHKRAIDPRYTLARKLFWFIRRTMYDMYDGGEIMWADEHAEKWKEIMSHYPPTPVDKHEDLGQFSDDASAHTSTSSRLSSDGESDDTSSSTVSSTSTAPKASKRASSASFEQSSAKKLKYDASEEYSLAKSHDNILTKPQPARKSLFGIRRGVGKMSKCLQSGISIKKTKNLSEAPCTSNSTHQAHNTPTAVHNNEPRQYRQNRPWGKRFTSWCSRKTTSWLGFMAWRTGPVPDPYDELLYTQPYPMWM